MYVVFVGFDFTHTHNVKDTPYRKDIDIILQTKAG